ALDNMKEEIIALVPVALLLTRRLGYPAVTAVAMSLGAAAVGAAFSPINPFQVGIAQQLAQIPLLSGSLFRMAFLALAVAAWIWGTMRHARRARAEPGAGADERPDPLGSRQIPVLLLVLATFVVLDAGRIVDTVVHGLFTPIAGLPLALSALAMMVVHTAVHVPVPSPSGHAVLTLPILVPLSDLLGLSRQVTVLAYQYGAGLCE